ncbi:MAG: M28 family peptidase [Balneolaceae bacterium]|nr:M28 family peptidase [Balneolaceae bacterium]
MKSFITLLVLVFISTSCAEPPIEKTAQSITKDSILRHIETLSSDEFEGRGTGTPGEQKAVEYLVNQLERIGAEPAAEDGSYIQPFPLLGQVTSNATMRVNSQNSFSPAYYDDFMAWPANQSTSVNVDEAELVYVGYGIQAPEESWDDFKEMDMSGKILVFKNSDPSYAPNLFGGNARLYYGRYTYKYEKAKELGALGALIIHTTETAGYGWNVVANGWNRERFYLKSENDSEKGETAFNGWLTYATSKALFEQAGLDVDAMLKAADSSDFEPVPLQKVSIDVSMDAEYREIQSQNIVAKVEGNDPQLKDEYLQLTAHFDHLGIINTAAEGDSINNGAADNAAGVSALLEMTKGYKQVQSQLKRSVLVVLVSAEEVGLLGSQYWAENPTVHPGKVSANINLDGMNVYGKTKDVVVVGYGRTTLSDLLEETAEEQGRKVVADPHADRGYFYRSDHFNMAKIGIPAIFPNPGKEFIDKGENFTALSDSVADANYHTVNDEINTYWDLSGAVIDTRLFFKTGYRALNAEQLQSWKPGDEFEATRLKMLEESQ